MCSIIILNRKKKMTGVHFKRKGLFDSGLLSKRSLRHLKDIFKAGNLPRVKSLLSRFIRTIINDHTSLSFIKTNDSPERNAPIDLQ